MKKALIVCTKYDFVINFEINNLLFLKSQGYSISLAANLNRDFNSKDISSLDGVIDEYYDIPFSRSILSFKNVKVFFKLKKIINKNNFSLIHCHNPIPSILTRVAATTKRKKSSLKVIYTAHGFHFQKNNGKLQGKLFYIVEKKVSKYTDAIITINKDDFYIAKQYFKSKIFYCPGVGVDIKKFKKSDSKRDILFSSYGVTKDDYIIISVGELNKNKNHIVVLEAIKNVTNNKVKYFIIGDGDTEESLNKYILNNNLDNQVFLLGYKTNISDYLNSADLFIHPSYREGLSLAIMEAVATNIPLLVSNIRGNRELVLDTYLFDPDDVNALVKLINEMLTCKDYKFIDITKFSLDNVRKIMNKIYIEVMQLS